MEFVRQVLTIWHPRLRCHAHSSDDSRARLHRQLVCHNACGALLPGCVRPLREPFLKPTGVPRRAGDEVDWAHFGSRTCRRGHVAPCPASVATLSMVARAVSPSSSSIELMENFLRGACPCPASKTWSGQPRREVLYDNLRRCSSRTAGQRIHFNPRLMELLRPLSFRPTSLSGSRR